jgi:hypothetical protein
VQGFLYWLAASTIPVSPGDSAKTKAATASCAHVSKLFGALAQELDDEGRKLWWPPVSHFLGIQISTFCSSLAGAGQQQADESPQAAARNDVFGRMSLEVLGGRMQKLVPGTGVELMDGRTGEVLQLTSGHTAWIGCKTSLMCVDMQSEVRHSKLLNVSHLGSSTLEMLVPLLVHIKDEVFQVHL